MRKHKLLVYELISRRMRGKLLFGLLLLLVLGIVDLFYPLFGDYWYWVWVAVAVLAVLWVYYGVLMRRASVKISDKVLLLQGPLRKVKISYGRIDSIAPTTLANHYPRESIPNRDQKLLTPLYQQTIVLVQMDAFPKALRAPKLWFSPYLFGKSQKGLLLAVENWMQLNQDLEVARTRWHERKMARTREDKRSLASQILDY
jgi:hypothetical protein